tara:strand:- start:411 stop:953 length:543 start_codon:yes stop_codon:yes gene_type:complete
MAQARKHRTDDYTKEELQKEVIELEGHYQKMKRMLDASIVYYQSILEAKHEYTTQQIAFELSRVHQLQKQSNETEYIKLKQENEKLKEVIERKDKTHSYISDCHERCMETLYKEKYELKQENEKLSKEFREKKKSDDCYERLLDALHSQMLKIIKQELEPDKASKYELEIDKILEDFSLK